MTTSDQPVDGTPKGRHSSTPQSGSGLWPDRQAAHRSSTFHSTFGTFRFTSCFTGTCLVRTSAQVGFHRKCHHEPQSSR
jgi:hypothetical protein